jgi:3-phenylpropionate/trans-cinnamate dioxygenase ferredoxin reductase component
VVVGGSIAAVTAAESLRLAGYDGSVTLVSNEDHPPYTRVPLSKGVLGGRQPIDSVYLPGLSADVELRLGVAATSLDVEARRVLLADGSSVPYDGLVIATGAKIRRLSTVDHYVRTVPDVLALAPVLTTARSVTVIGAGFLGMEVASSCVELGLAVTVVDRDPPLRRLLGQFLADLVVAAAREVGVRFVRGLAEDVALASDVVVAAVGEDPAVDWLRDSPVPLDPVLGGVVVDDCCRVGPGIVAAGDVAVRSGTRRPHWTNAVEQGQAAARALLDPNPVPYTPDPYYWTEQFGLDVKLAGEFPALGEATIVDGDVADRRCLVTFRRGDRVCSVAAVNYKLPVRRLKSMVS